VINPQGEFLGVFGKDHPVVFGGETSLTRGTYPVYETDLGVLGTIICYDLDYTDTARKLARQGVQLVGVPSNDWGSIAEKHYTHVVFRAVENRIAMVKADGGFDSAIIDPFGRIVSLAAFPEGGEATLVADVQMGNGKGTITTRLGDWMGWLALAGMLFFSFGGSWLVKNASKEIG
jgi:apolipoprotein N-acyltransferase